MVKVRPPEPPRTVAEAESLYADIGDAADEAIDAGISVEGEEFMDDVLAKAGDIIAAVEDRQTCTPGQYSALENMLEGVRAWMPR